MADVTHAKRPVRAADSARDELIRARREFIYCYSVATTSDPTAALQIYEDLLGDVSAINEKIRKVNGHAGAASHRWTQTDSDRNSEICSFLEGRPEGAGIDEIGDYLTSLNMKEQRASLTTRINRLVKKEMIARKKRGHYVFATK